jgi:hypothetical protein
LYAVNDLGFVSNPTHLAISVVPLPKPSNSGSRGLGTRAIAGIAIGCGVIGIALILLTVICIIKKKNKRGAAFEKVPEEIKSRSDPL